MSKVKLSKSELAALDALIAAIGNESPTYSAGNDFAFIAAIARVTKAATKVAVKATPYVAEVTPAVIGEANNKDNFSELMDGGDLSLESLINLRKAAS